MCLTFLDNLRFSQNRRPQSRYDFYNGRPSFVGHIRIDSNGKILAHHVPRRRLAKSSTANLVLTSANAVAHTDAEGDGRQS